MPIDYSEKSTVFVIRPTFFGHVVLLTWVSHVVTFVQIWEILFGHDWSLLGDLGELRG